MIVLSDPSVSKMHFVDQFACSLCHSTKTLVVIKSSK